MVRYGPAKPFDCVGIDLCGPLPCTAVGKRWAAGVIERLTRYAETAVLSAVTVRDVASLLLNRFVLHHGASG